MIEVEDKVSEMANGVLFEQNTTALRNSFKSQVESYLSSIVQRNGLYSAEVNLDGNTDAAIDRNEFHCVVGLKPAKDIEFIYLTFTVKATGNTVAEA
jgi:phage tail sheath protein FI